MFVCDASQTNKHIYIYIYIYIYICIYIYIYIFLGGEDGLFMLEIADAGAHRLGGKKVGHIEEGKGHSRLPWTWVMHVYMILVDQAGCAVCSDKRVV